MALHVASLKAAAAVAPAAHPAPRTGSSQVRRPESSSQPSFPALLARPRITAASTAGGTAGSGSSGTATTADDPGATDTAPTAESVFGTDPWVDNPQGLNPDGSTYALNPQWFATPETAAKVAQMLGGTVVQVNAIIDNPVYRQMQPNEMVQLANGALINPGLVAGFYTHGYPQSMVDRMIAEEVAGD